MNSGDVEMKILLYAKKIAELEFSIACKQKELEECRSMKVKLENIPEPIPSLEDRVMELLRMHPEGLKTREIAESLGMGMGGMHFVLGDLKPEITSTTIPGTKGLRLWRIAEIGESDSSQWESLISNGNE
jgi:hypothetical protein